MSATEKELVPLPEHLKECGCSLAKMGRHKTTCIPARKYDASMRDIMEPGKRYSVVSWEYPLSIEATVRVTVDLDPFEFILANRNEYERFEMDGSYEEWEKPIVFLSSLLEEDMDIISRFDGGRHVSRCTVLSDDFDEHPRWTPDMTRQLDEMIAKRPTPFDPGPDQGTLLDA